MSTPQNSSFLSRKISGILRSTYVPPVSEVEMAPTLSMDPSAPRDTLSLECPCGYIKRDVMCIGDAVDRDQKLFHFCGGLFILISRSTVECSRCRKTSSRISFTCPFCALESVVILSKPIRGQAIPVLPRSKNPDRPPSRIMTDKL